MREVETNYTVFTHVIDASGQLAGQKDSWPRDGAYPTTVWKRGEVVQDEYVIPLTGGGPGEYRLEMGLYARDTGQRLAALANGQRLVNDTVNVPLTRP